MCARLHSLSYSPSPSPLSLFLSPLSLSLSPPLSHTGWLNHLHTVSDIFHDPCVSEGGYSAQFISDSDSPSSGNVGGISTAGWDIGKTGKMVWIGRKEEGRERERGRERGGRKRKSESKGKRERESVLYILAVIRVNINVAFHTQRSKSKVSTVTHYHMDSLLNPMGSFCHKKVLQQSICSYNSLLNTN